MSKHVTGRALRRTFQDLTREAEVDAVDAVDAPTNTIANIGVTSTSFILGGRFSPVFWAPLCAGSLQAVDAVGTGETYA